MSLSNATEAAALDVFLRGVDPALEAKGQNDLSDDELILLFLAAIGD